MDKMSKFSDFIPLKYPFIAIIMVEQFIKEIVRLHEIPTSIVLDRDKVSTSAF